MSEWEEYDAIHNARNEADARKRLKEWEKVSVPEKRCIIKSCSAARKA